MKNLKYIQNKKCRYNDNKYVINWNYMNNSSTQSSIAQRAKINSFFEKNIDITQVIDRLKALVSLAGLFDSNLPQNLFFVRKNSTNEYNFYPVLSKYSSLRGIGLNEASFNEAGLSGGGGGGNSSTKIKFETETVEPNVIDLKTALLKSTPKSLHEFINNQLKLIENAASYYQNNSFINSLRNAGVNAITQAIFLKFKISMDENSTDNLYSEAQIQESKNTDFIQTLPTISFNMITDPKTGDKFSCSSRFSCRPDDFTKFPEFGNVGYVVKSDKKNDNEEQDINLNYGHINFTRNKISKIYDILRLPFNQTSFEQKQEMKKLILSLDPRKNSLSNQNLRDIYNNGELFFEERNSLGFIAYAVYSDSHDWIDFLKNECKCSPSAKYANISPVIMSIIKGNYKALEMLIDDAGNPKNQENDYKIDTRISLNTLLNSDNLYLFDSKHQKELLDFLYTEGQLQKELGSTGVNYDSVPIPLLATVLYLHSDEKTTNFQKLLSTLHHLGGDFNLQSHGGNSPLMCAVDAMDYSMVRCLVEKCGANINIKDYADMTPLQFAQYIKNKTLSFKKVPELDKIISFLSILEYEEAEKQTKNKEKEKSMGTTKSVFSKTQDKRDDGKTMPPKTTTLNGMPGSSTKIKASVDVNGVGLYGIKLSDDFLSGDFSGESASEKIKAKIKENRSESQKSEEKHTKKGPGII